MLSFYRTFDDVKENYYDGLIITGAPVEQMPFESVTYWDELCRIMEWSKTHVTSTFHICWGAQAGLYYHYGINKHPLEEKLFGIFDHKKDKKDSILLRGFDDVFPVPHSRHTYIKREDIEAHPELKILASSDRAGVYALSNHGGSQVFITGHSEYDADTLKRNTSAIKTQACPLRCRKTISPMMTIQRSLWSRGAAMQTCSTQTGSTISSTRPHPTTFRP